MSDDITYASISEIHDALVRKEYAPQKLYEYLATNYDAYHKWQKARKEGNAQDADRVDKILGSEIAFHNLSVEFSRRGCGPYAAMIAFFGVSEYPLSTDLIADQIKYFQKIGNKAMCQKGFDKLKGIPRKYWNWRTYVFAIDFLKDGLSSAESVEAFEEDLKLAKSFIDDFKINIPHDERSYVAEAELLENQGEFDNAMAVLEEAIKKVAVAPQCCLKLADMKLERGAYEDVARYAQKGILMATEEQPSVSVGYLYYLLALAMDATRIKTRQKGDSLEDGQIRKIANAFRTADRLLLNEERKDVAYRKTIRAKLIVLEMEENIYSGLSPLDAEEKQSEKPLALSDLLTLKKILENDRE